MTTIFPTARDQAKAQTESIAAMVARREHCRGCDGEWMDFLDVGGDCDLTDKEIREGINVAPGITEEERQAYHNGEDARQTILEHPISVKVRSGWTTPGGDMEPAEYSILLCTGHDAAVRVQGNLSLGQPVTAYAEHLGWSVRDGWDTTWTRYDPPHPADWTPGRRTPFEAFVQPALLAYAAEILA